MSELYDWSKRGKTTREIILQEWSEEKRLTNDNIGVEKRSAKLWKKMNAKKSRKAEREAREKHVNQTTYLRDRAKEAYSLSNGKLQKLVDPSVEKEPYQMGFIGQLIIAIPLAIIIIGLLYYLMS